MADKKRSGLFNMLLSALNPEINRLAESLVSKLPEGSPLKSEMVSRIMGVASAWLEQQAGSLKSSLGSAGVEKASDFLEFVGNALRRSGKGGVKTQVDWVGDFRKEALSRLQSAPNPEEELEKIVSEFKLRLKLLQKLEEALEASQPKKPVPSMMQLSEVAPHIDRITERLQALRAERREQRRRS